METYILWKRQSTLVMMHEAQYSQTKTQCMRTMKYGSAAERERDILSLSDSTGPGFSFADSKTFN